MRQLRSFAVVAAAGSITRASQELFIAQPALTRQVAALERATGLQLLVRGPKGVTLTAAGQRFLAGAELVLAAYARLVRGPTGGRDHVPRDEAEVDAPEHGGGGRAEQGGRVAMRLGVEADAPLTSTEFISSFAGGRPGAMWKVSRAHESDLWAMLAASQVDGAVVWLPAPDDSMATATIDHVQFNVALPTGLAGRYPDRVPRSVFADLPVALWDRDLDVVAYDYWATLIADGVDRVVFQPVTVGYNAQQHMLRDVERGAAVTVVTDSHWSSAPVDGVTVRPLDPPLVAPLRLAWRSDRPNAWIADLVSAFCG